MHRENFRKMSLWTQCNQHRQAACTVKVKTLYQTLRKSTMELVTVSRNRVTALYWLYRSHSDQTQT